MCNLSYGIAERNYNYGVVVGHKKGVLEGKAEGQVAMLLAVMNSFHLTAEEAMDKLHIPADEQKKLLPLLRK